MMMSEEDLNDVDGWLLTYVILKYAGALWAAFQTWLLFRTATTNGHSPNHALLLLVLLIAVGSLTSVAAATAVLRTSRWSLQLVGLDLLYACMGLVIAAIIGVVNGVGSQQFPLVETVVQIAVLYAWFQYFRVSRRVHAIFGRNLLEDAAEPA